MIVKLAGSPSIWHNRLFYPDYWIDQPLKVVNTYTTLSGSTYHRVQKIGGDSTRKLNLRYEELIVLDVNNKNASTLLSKEQHS